MSLFCKSLLQIAILGAALNPTNANDSSEC